MFAFKKNRLKVVKTFPRCETTFHFVVVSNSAACSSAVRKPAISLADSTDLRVLLNIMYLMVETIQQDDPADKPEWKIIRETFRAELGELSSFQFSLVKFSPVLFNQV